MAHIISLINHKGGVGKTTSTAGIGAGLNLLKKRVLLIDVDPQANLTRHFGLPKNSDKSIYGALKGEYPLPVHEIKKGLDMVPSHTCLVGWEKEVSDEPGRESFLKAAIEPLASKYDYILIDCPPSLGYLPINALSASQSIIIVVEPSAFAIDGMGNIFNAVNKVQSRINKDLTGCKILITNFFSKKVLHQDVESTLRENYKNQVFKTVVRTNVALEEAVMTGVDVFTYDSSSNGAIDYKNVCSEIIKEKQWEKVLKAV
ncbi:MAG: ParA family protein [Bacteroidales bacterium]|jgi:chromosome partitioning protein|nr:ParA family protein [Bacteroidales bacterium]